MKPFIETGAAKSLEKALHRYPLIEVLKLVHDIEWNKSLDSNDSERDRPPRVIWTAIKELEWDKEEGTAGLPFGTQII